MSVQPSKVHALRPRPAAAPVKAKARSWRNLSSRAKALVALAGVVALPAFAATGDWSDRFEIGNASDQGAQVQPMPFEKAGSSFPGSAFYYLDQGKDEPGLGEGIHSDADGDNAQKRLDPGPPALAMRVDNSGVDRSRALDCLTAAVYYEAASESDAGQRAVAQVVLNRVAHPAYPKTVCGVVYQGSARHTGCQFTFTCDGALARKPNPMFWQRARTVAEAALGGYVFAPVGLATHYHTIQVNPYWAPSLHYLVTIGAHRFYSFDGRAGARSTFNFAYRGGEPSAASLRDSGIATESDRALDPVALQRAYDEGLARAQAAAAPQQTAPALTPAPHYTAEQQARGGDTLYRGTNLPEATGVRDEYRNSGRWIARPGT